MSTQPSWKESVVPAVSVTPAWLITSPMTSGELAWTAMAFQGLVAQCGQWLDLPAQPANARMEVSAVLWIWSVFIIIEVFKMDSSSQEKNGQNDHPT